MPPHLVYQVDFANGNLRPSVDVNRWGELVPGGSTAGTPSGSDDLGVA